jgi:hypothetical protein
LQQLLEARIIMAKKVEENEALIVRGRIYPAHPLFWHLGRMAPKNAFKLLSDLALEGYSSKSSTQQLISLDHPLGSTLRAMSTEQAFAYLLGATSKHGQDDSRVAVALSPAAYQENRTAPTVQTPDQPQTVASPRLVVDSGHNTVELDTDDLDALFAVDAPAA